jgi:hypothetical protein
MRVDDPAYWMLDNVPRTPVEAFRPGCYICEDDEFARMGLPLCKFCQVCSTGHVPADDVACDDCGADQEAIYWRHVFKVADRATVRRALRYARG